ncbi:MAG: nucleoside phosphorylase [Bdellovibrionales bacterium]|nr:nucleoside phosphorylase [Bdellovibrionales bacterium]
MKPYLFVPGKYKKPSLVSPEGRMTYFHKSHKIKDPTCLPSRAILCFWDGLARSLKKRKDFQKSLSVHETGGLHVDLYRTGQENAPSKLRSSSGRSLQKRQNSNPISIYKPQSAAQSASVAVVSRFGIGAPAGVVCLENLRAYGVKEFISVGLVGSLNSNLKLGSKVLIKKSFRGEGCSYHYRAPFPYVEMSESEERGMYLKLIKELKLKPVVSWTTDAPFRETKEEVLYFQSKGVECVEMEASALMAVGEYYGVSVFCLGVVSDHLSPEAWTPGFFDPSVKKSLSELLNKILFLYTDFV